MELHVPVSPHFSKSINWQADYTACLERLYFFAGAMKIAFSVSKGSESCYKQMPSMRSKKQKRTYKLINQFAKTAAYSASKRSRMRSQP